MIPKLKYYILTYIAVIIINYIALIQHNEIMALLVRPLIIIVLLIMYFNTVYKVRWPYVIALISIIIADYNYQFGKDYILIAMSLYSLNHLLITFEVIKLNKKINLKQLITYFSILLTAFAIVFLYVLKQQNGYDASVIAFGVTLCILVACAVVNYIKNNSLPNLYLMFGLILSVFTNIIISLNAFDLSSELNLNLISTTLLAIIHFTICYSFIIRDLKPKKVLN